MIYLHIGQPKCASTTIQEFAHQNADVLERYGLIYPRGVFGNSSHHELMSAFVLGNNKPLIATLSEILSAHRDKDIFLSHEGFFFKADEAVVEHVAFVLGKYHEVKIIAYCRDYARVALSLYNQKSKKALNVLAFDKFLELADRGKRWHGLERLKIWADRFGASNVRLRSIDCCDLEGGSVLSDICAALGLPIKVLEEADPQSTQAANVTPPWEVVEYIRAFTQVSAEFLTTVPESALEKLKFGGGSKIVQASCTTDPEATKINSLFVNRMLDCCMNSISDRSRPQPQYLTPEQADYLIQRYESDLDIAARLLNRPRRHQVNIEAIPPRPFEPGYRHVCEDVRSLIREGLHTLKPFNRLPTALHSQLIAAGL